jgi:hypothetical protein
MPVPSPHHMRLARGAANRVAFLHDEPHRKMDARYAVISNAEKKVASAGLPMSP